MHRFYTVQIYKQNSTAANLSISSSRLPIAEHGPRAEEDIEPEQGEELCAEVGQGAALKVDAAEHLDEVAGRVQPCQDLSPAGHGGYGCGEKLTIPTPRKTSTAATPLAHVIVSMPAARLIHMATTGCT